MSKTKWMIYGANGYTGHLIAAEAVRRGMTPVLAGRTPAAIHSLGTLLGLECRIFDPQQHAQACHALHDIAVVAHCAGPFSATSAAMVSACLTSKTHYVDITGEISVFEAAFNRHQAALDAGVVLCPGVGFDVIPTDCIAACLHQAMPDASQLSLGFETSSGLSPGTAKTTIEGLKLGGKIRRAGVITDVPLGYKRRQIDFGRGTKAAVTIPWGDISTAYHTTHIGNIEVYLPAPSAVAILMALLSPIRGLFGISAVENGLKRLVEKFVKGPDEIKRKHMRTWLWGEVRNAAGEIKTAHLETANGYDVTVEGVLFSVNHLLAYQGPGGYFTPSTLLGERCIEQLNGSGQIVIS